MGQRKADILGPAHCLECGAEIGEEEDQCQVCGWTWVNSDIEQNSSGRLPWLIRPSIVLSACLFAVVLVVTYRVGKARGYHHGRMEITSLVISNCDLRRDPQTGRSIIDARRSLSVLFSDVLGPTFRRSPGNRIWAAREARKISNMLKVSAGDEAKQTEGAHMRNPTIERMMSYGLD